MTYGIEFKNRFSDYCMSIETPREAVYQQSLELIELEDINSESVVLDLGSNYGDFLKALAPAGCTIHSFEPHPMFYGKILESYGKYDNITFHKKAAWNRNEVKKFYFKNSPTAENGGATLMSEKTNITNLSLYKEVECIDISELIQSIGHIDVLKMDVEGAEYEILNRIYETGALKCIKSIYFEDHERKMPSARYSTLKQEVINNFSSVNKELYWW